MARKLVVLTVVLMGLTASSAAATTIDVTTTADVMANDGRCSLREAIAAANTDTPSGSAPGECPAGTPGANCLSTDQRRVPRPQGEACDAASLEVQAPKLALSPRRLKFGRLRMGRVRAKTVRVSYVGGDDPAILNTAKISGRDTRDFAIVKNRCRDTILHTSQWCTMTISFRPRRRGLRTATVTLNVSSPGRPVKIGLVGIGLR